jgi:hypothetical protein
MQGTSWVTYDIHYIHVRIHRYNYEKQQCFPCQNNKKTHKCFAFRIDEIFKKKNVQS